MGHASLVCPHSPESESFPVAASRLSPTCHGPSLAHRATPSSRGVWGSQSPSPAACHGSWPSWEGSLVIPQTGLFMTQSERNRGLSGLDKEALAPEPGCGTRETTCPARECRDLRCVPVTGLLGREDTVFAPWGPRSAGERGLEKGGKPGVEEVGRVEAGPEASVPPLCPGWSARHLVSGACMWSRVVRSRTRGRLHCLVAFCLSPLGGKGRRRLSNLHLSGFKFPFGMETSRTRRLPLPGS